MLEEARNAALELPLPTTEEAFDKGVCEEQADEIRAIVALFRFRIISDTLLEVPLVKTFLDGPDTVARDHLRRRSFLPRPFARIRGKVCVPRSGGLRSASMRVEVLYFDGCPTYLEAEKTLRDVLSQEDAEVELVVVNTDEEARKPDDKGGRRGPVPGAGAERVRAWLQDVRHPGRAEGVAHRQDAQRSASELPRTPTGEVRRIALPRTSVNRGFLFWLLWLP